MLCIRGTSHGPVSVCPSVCPSVRLSVCQSVTSRCSTKTAKRRITQITPHDSPGTLVFCCQRSPRNSTGVTPYHSTSHPAEEKSSLKGAWSGSNNPHCLRLNLQLHTIDLVRTCRISSFCTVAWQLARFQLTRRIARSLGDSRVSCIKQHSQAVMV